MDSPSFTTPLALPNPISSPQLSSSKDVERLSSRQHRLLRSRDAKFPGKRLSSPNLAGSIARLSSSSDNTTYTDYGSEDQENTPPAKEEHVHGFKRNCSLPSLGFSKDLSILSKSQSLRRRENVPVHEDRRVEDTSNTPSPVILATLPAWNQKSPGVSHVSSKLDNMQLREVSCNGGRPLSSRSSQNGLSKLGKKQKSQHSRPSFDTDEYIDHIERELQQAKEAMYSPTSNRSIKEQLKSARAENARLKHDIADIRHAFETEVQRTVEHKTAFEVELRRKVKNLEDEVERKEVAIRDLEYDYEEKRLDCNAIETLKSTIERLEHEKTAMLDENRSLSKRNEVLSQLLALSPTKSHATIELRSPIREKRGGRPMSMIIPRVPSSPVMTTVRSQPGSAVTSPSLRAAATMSGVSTLSSESLLYANSVCSTQDDDSSAKLPPSRKTSEQQCGTGHTTSRASTIDFGDLGEFDPMAVALPASPLDNVLARPVMKRKPRKFMSGSTQLKPLLLPALTSDSSGQLSGSIITSPRSAMSREPLGEPREEIHYFSSLSQDSPADDFEQDTIMPGETEELYSAGSNPGKYYQTFEEILAGQSMMSSGSDEGRYQPRANPSSLHDNEYRSSSTRSKSSAAIELQTPAIRAHAMCLKQSTGLDAQYDTEANSGRDAFDLDALQDLTLPRTEFDAFPRLTQDVDQQLLLDVPQPLFSPITRQRGVRRDRDHPDVTLRRMRPRSPPDDSNPRKRPFWRSVDRTDLISPNSRALYPWSSPPLLVGSSLEPLSLPHGATLRSNSSNLLLSPATSSMYLERAKTPLGLLQHKHFSAQPWAALTIRALYGTISQCTTYVRDLKRDPLALARRVIANAWLSNWSRLGKLSWWVLGLFIPQAIPQQRQDWDWEDYDGEAVARRYCDTDEAQDDVQLTQTHDSNEASSPMSIDDISRYQRLNHKRTGWGSSLMLWGKFSVAIMLAVGVAVVKGPGEMLKDVDHRLPNWPAKRNQGNRRHHERRLSKSHIPTADFADAQDRTDMSSLFTFRSPRELFTDESLHVTTGRDRDETLRPNKSQKRHAADVFSPDDPGGYAFPSDTLSQDFDFSQVKSDTKVNRRGSLVWLSESDDIYPDDSASVTGLRQLLM